MIEEGVRERSLRGLRHSRRPRGRRARRAGGPVGGRRLKAVLGVLAAVLLLAAGWMWLRDSPLVAVRKVTISGLTGAQAPRIRAALTLAARGMTTLGVRTQTLRAAVSSYPVVKGLKVSAHFPHGLEITVTEQLPVAALMVGGRAVPVAADGTVLHDGAAPGPLPSLAVKALPGGSTVQDPAARLQLRVLGAAPNPMLARIAEISTNYWHGVVLALRQGPTIYFGAGDQLKAKWRAALSVLALPSTAGAGYIDVTDPQRPAAGAGGSVPSATPTTTTTTATATATAGGTTTASGAGTTGAGTPAAGTAAANAPSATPPGSVSGAVGGGG